MQKTVYQMNVDGYYVGPTIADASPLVRIGTTVVYWNGNPATVEWLIPGGCVEVEPPALPDGKSAKWNGSGWDIVDPPADALPPIPDAPVAPEPLGAEPKTPTRVYKSQVWLRATDEEADEIEAALKAAPARLRGLWNDSMYFDVTDPLFGQIKGPFVAAFGEERTAYLLEPAE